MKIKIEIDDAMSVTVSHPCESCGVMVPTTEYCGNTRPDGSTEYLCESCYVPDPNGNFKTPECYVRQSVDRAYIHDWLIFLDEDHPLECGPIAIHKDVVGNRAHRADCSTPDPEDGVTRFGPGSLSLSMTSIDDLFFDVTHVYTLADEGLIDGQKAHTIFKIQGGE